MRDLILGVVVGGAVLAGLPGFGQMHKVAKPEQVVRAVGVYEWTGDMAKPTASRLIPVSLFIDNHMEDAGVYLARPVPFALDTGNVYELREAGIDRGTLDLAFARHFQTENGDFDDGWFGYGSYKAPALEKPRVARKRPQARTAGIESSVADSDSDRPTLVRRHGSESPPAAGTGQSTTGSGTSAGSSTGTSAGSSTASTGSVPADDPDRPTLHRPASSDSSGDSSTAGSGTSTASTGSIPADDPDRPTLQRPASSGSSSGDSASTGTGSGTSSGTTGSVPADDPDRPTLKRRSAAEQRAANADASVDGVGSLNDDPNRPRLHYGKPAGVVTEADFPKLTGLPGVSGTAGTAATAVNVHQMVAVSDAVDRDPHNFARAWADAAEKTAVMTKMEALARTQLAGYDDPAVAAAAAAAAANPPKTTNKLRRRTAVVAPAPVALMDEVLKGYTLSYGGDPTYVFMAHTDGTGATLRYVTVVAQDDGMGELKPAIQSVTDAAHLDRTAQMNFVDVVDADASNRASLLFELREQSSRQFALYRVIAAQAQQTFLSGTTQ